MDSLVERILTLTYRKASPNDATRLWELRREAILRLAPRGMSIAHAHRWAAAKTLEGMEQQIHEADIWIAKVDSKIVGWVAIRGDYLDGLYTDPDFSERGVGTELLRLAEELMRERGIRTVRAEASRNAEGFYLRRGYEPVGSRRPDGARPLVKSLA